MAVLAVLLAVLVGGDWDVGLSQAERAEFLGDATDARKPMDPEALPDPDLPVRAPDANLPSGGNPICFEDGFFTFQECCESPNDSCWDEIYSFETCCFPAQQNISDRLTLFGCRNRFFETFRYDAWVYFKFGEVHPRIFASQARALANWRKHEDLCAPSVLTAILIKLHEDLAMQPLSTSVMGILQYGDLLQKFLRLGKITEKEMRVWPLEIGHKHLETVLPGGAAGREPSGGGGGGSSKTSSDSSSATARQLQTVRHQQFLAKWRSSKRSLEVVMPYCREPAERILDWWAFAFSGFVLAHIVVTVVMKCGNTPANQRVPLQIFNGTRAVRFLEILDEEVRGDECSGYFGFLENRFFS